MSPATSRRNRVGDRAGDRLGVDSGSSQHVVWRWQVLGQRGGPALVMITGVTRRIAASLALVALTAASLGTAPSVAAAGAKQSANVEAVCPAPTPGTAQCLALRRTDIGARPGSAVSPLLTPSGYGPADIQSAYALPTSQGSGMTVAIVDAYDLPTAEADLATYRSYFGLPACTTANGCFRKVNQSGGTDMSQVPSAVGKGWDGEIALDIDMV